LHDDRHDEHDGFRADPAVSTLRKAWTPTLFRRLATDFACSRMSQNSRLLTKSTIVVIASRK
jgi:hypothetical protein